MKIALIFLFVAFALGVSSQNADPCDSYTEIDDPTRSVSYGGGDLCDGRRGLAEGWYRFVGSGGNIISTSCVERYHCNSYATLWMVGDLPELGEGEVTRTSCRTSPECKYGGCYSVDAESVFDMKVKKCEGGYYVYYLTPPTTCPIRYCTDFEKDSLSSTISVPNLKTVNSAECPDGWTHFEAEQVCVFRSRDILKNWADAKRACENHIDGQARLVKIENEAKNTFVNSLRESDGAFYWIGLNDIKREGSFVWTDGTPLGSYTTWNDGQPDNAGDEDCVHLFYYPKWNDLPCEQFFYDMYYFCEMEIPVQPAVCPEDNKVTVNVNDLCDGEAITIKIEIEKTTNP